MIGNPLKVNGNAVAVSLLQLKSAMNIPFGQSCSAHNWFNTIAASGLMGCAQPSYSDLLGSLPQPVPSSLGGVFSKTCAAGQFVQSVNTDGSETCGVPSIAAAAAKSDQQAGTSGALAVTPLHQQDHASAVKAWVLFDSSTTPVIAASYNVSSVVKNSTGDFTVNFTTAFASTSYVCHVTAEAAASNGWGQIRNGGRAVGSVRVQALNQTPAAFDPISTSVTCYGRQ